MAVTFGNVYRHRLTEKILFVPKSETAKDYSGTLKIGKLTAGWLRINKGHLDRDWIRIRDREGVFHAPK